MFLIRLLLLWATCGSAQAQSFHTVSGRVLDGDNGLPLPGATVRVENTNQGAATDLNGYFEIAQVAAGEVVLIITFIGFENKQIAIEVPTITKVGSVILEPRVVGLAEVTVRGALEGQQKALNQQRASDNIKNVISADLIGRFPDLNVAEALQRVPGINIQRDKGEGSTISIRGTPTNFTTVQINGEQLPSVQQSGARNEALDLIPADQLASMEITKAPTPDLDGDAIGGVVNLKTPTAQKTAWGLRAESGLGYNDISGGVNGIGRLRVDKRFFDKTNTDGKVGLMAGVSYYATDNSEDRADAAWLGEPQRIAQTGTRELVMGRYEFRRTENQRERIGTTLTLDYQPADNHQLIFNYMYNRREDNDLRNRLRYDFDRPTTTWTSFDSINNARIRRDINIWDERKTNQSFNVQGFHQWPQWKTEWGLYYTRSNRTYTSARGDFARDEIRIRTQNADGIFARVPQFVATDPEQDVHNPLLLNDFRRFEDDFETSDATHFVAKLDVSRNFLLRGKTPLVFKWGGKARQQTNRKFRNNIVYGIFDPNGVINRAEAFIRVIGDTEPAQFLDGQARFGPRVVRDRYFAYLREIRAVTTTADNAWDSRRLSLSDTYDAFEDIYAGYAMGKLQFDKLMILAGLRYEFNDVRYDAFDVERRGTDVQGRPISGGNDYHFVLPNIHLKYALTRFSNLRVASVFNYARPNFTDVVPFVNYDADALILNLGNPQLRPAAAYNVDVMYERYFANVGILSVGAFYKNIDFFQFSRIDPSLEADYPGYPGTAGFRFRQELNGENAKVGGLEVNLVTPLEFLPGLLKNLGVNFNYTWSNSTAFTQDRSDISLPGQAAHTFNAALSYDYKKASLKTSFNYNGRFLNSVASTPQDDIIQEARLQVDLSASYEFTKRWRVYGEWINATNAPAIQFQGDESRLARLAYFGWWTRFGISYRL